MKKAASKKLREVKKAFKVLSKNPDFIKSIVNKFITGKKKNIHKTHFIEVSIFHFSFLLVISNNYKKINKLIDKFGIEERFNKSIFGMVLYDPDDNSSAMVFNIDKMKESTIVHECYHMAEIVFFNHLGIKKMVLKDREIMAHLVEYIYSEVKKKF